MVNAAPIEALLAQGEHLLAFSLAIIWGYAAGRPIRRRIIRKWAKHG